MPAAGMRPKETKRNQKKPNGLHLSVVKVKSNKFKLKLFKREKGVCSSSLETQITMLQCTIAGGRTKEANERSFVFFHQHGRDDLT